MDRYNGGKFDFVDYGAAAKFEPKCPGDDNCETDTYHMTGCPKLKRDLQEWKNR